MIFENSSLNNSAGIMLPVIPLFHEKAFFSPFSMDTSSTFMSSSNIASFYATSSLSHSRVFVPNFRYVTTKFPFQALNLFFAIFLPLFSLSLALFLPAKISPAINSVSFLGRQLYSTTSQLPAAVTAVSLVVSFECYAQ